MSIDSSMDKMLQRRQEVEAQLSRSAELSNKQLADFSRELSELRPVCRLLLRRRAGPRGGFLLPPFLRRGAPGPSAAVAWPRWRGFGFLGPDFLPS